LELKLKSDRSQNYYFNVTQCIYSNSQLRVIHELWLRHSFPYWVCVLHPSENRYNQLSQLPAKLLGVMLF
jgi:hypothetical protein